MSLEEFVFDLQLFADNWIKEDDAYYLLDDNSCVDLNECEPYSITDASGLREGGKWYLNVSNHYFSLVKSKEEETEGFGYEIDESAQRDGAEITVAFDGDMGDDWQRVENIGVLNVRAADKLHLAWDLVKGSSIKTKDGGEVGFEGRGSYKACDGNTAEFKVGVVNGAVALIFTDGTLSLGLGTDYDADPGTEISYGTVAEDGNGTINGTLALSKIDGTGAAPLADVAVSGGTLSAVSNLAPNSGITGVGIMPVSTKGEAGSYAVNGIAFSTDDVDGVTIANSAADTLTITELAEGKKVTTITADKAYIVNGIKYVASAGVELTASTATLDVDEYVTVGNKTYRGAAGGATFQVTGTNDSPVVTLESGAVALKANETITVGGKTYTAAADNTTLSVEEGKVTLTGGSIKLSNGAQLVISGTTYTAAANGATIACNNGTAKLTAGAVTIPSYGYLTANDCTFQVSLATSPITVDSDGKVTLPASSMTSGPNYLFDIIIPAGKIASVNGKTYTAKEYQVALSITSTHNVFSPFDARFEDNSAGSVVLGADAALIVKQSHGNYVTFTNTLADKTVEVDNSGLRAMSEGAACTVSLDSNTSVTVAGKTYTATDGATLSVLAASEVTKNEGSAEVTLKDTRGTNGVKISNGAVVIANGVTVTNTATADLTVQAKNGEAIVTTAAGGSCSAVIGAGEDATIDGTIYTNASTTETATITMAHGGTAVLTAGAVTIPNGGSVTVVGDSSQTSKITTTSATAQIAVQNGTYTLSNLTNNDKITIDGVTYTYNDTNKTLLDTTAGVTTGFLLKNSLLGNGSATFAIKGDTTTASDTIDPESGTEFINITRPGALAAAIAGLNIGDSLYFDAYGNQQKTNDGASYKLKKDSSGVLLFPIDELENVITIDAAGVTNLSVNFYSHGADGISFKIDGNTSIIGNSVLAKDCKIVDSNGKILAEVAEGGAWFNATSGEVTLLAGNFSNNTTYANINGNSVYIAGAEEEKGVFFGTYGGKTIAVYDKTNGVTLTSGDVTYGSATTTAKVNGVTYTQDGGEELAFYREGDTTATAIVRGMGVAVGTNAPITVASPIGTETTTLRAVTDTGSNLKVTVNSDGMSAYTFAGLDNGDEVIIDDVTYRYNSTAHTLITSDENKRSLLFGGDTVSFYCLNGEDIPYNAIDFLSNISTLKNVIDKIRDDIAEYYFDASGDQQYDGAGAAYTLTKTTNGSQVAYTLTSTEHATEALAIDASGVTGLTVDFVAASTGAQTLVVSNATQIVSCNLGHRDIVNNGNTTYTAAANGATINYNNGATKLTAGSVTFDNGKAIVVGDTTYTAAANGTTVDYNGGAAKLTAGAVTLKNGAKILIGERTYTAAANGTTIDYNGGTAKLTAGAITLAKDNGIEVAGKGLVTNNGTAAIAVDKDGNITWTATDDVSFTTKDSSEDTANLHTYKVKNGNLFVYNADSTDVKIYSAWASVTMATNEQYYYGEVVKGTPATGGDIHVAPTATTKAGNHYFNADGIELPDSTGAAVTVNYSKDGADATATIAVSSPLKAKVNLTGAAVTSITGADKNATYVIDGSEFTGEDFKTSVVSGKTLIQGNVTATSPSGSYALADNNSSVKFEKYTPADGETPASGTQLTGVKVTSTELGTVTITEANVSNDTVIRGNGYIEGLDENATVNTGKITARVCEGLNDFSMLVAEDGTIFTSVNDYACITLSSEGKGEAAFIDGANAIGLKNVTVVAEHSKLAGADAVCCYSRSKVEVNDAGEFTLLTGNFEATDDKTVLDVKIAADQNEGLAISGIFFGKAADTEVTGIYNNSSKTAVLTSKAGSLFTAIAGVKLTVNGTEYVTAKENTGVTYDATNGARMTSGAVILENDESIEVYVNATETEPAKSRGTITNNGSVPIMVDINGNVYNAEGGTKLTGGESFTTSDGTYTVKYTLSADAKEIKVMQTVDGKKKTAIYKAADTIAVTMQEGAGAFVTGDFTSLNELSGVSTDLADITEIKLPPIKEISTLATFDALGQETEEASEIAITVDGTANPKKVTVSKTVDASVPIDLTATEASVTDKTGTAVFTINDAALSGEAFSVKDNIVTETGNLVTVSSGDLQTSDRDGNFSLPGGSSLTTTGNGTLTINGEKITLTGSGNGVTYTADKTKPNKISAITGMEDGEAVTFASTFTGGEITVDGTAFTAITSRNGLTFRQQGHVVETSLDQEGETVTVDGFTFVVKSTSHSGLTVCVDKQGSQVAGLQNGDKVTVTKDGLTTTYTAYDGKLVIGYTDGDAKATTKSYTLGSEKSFTATWDGSAANAPVSTGDAGLSLTPGSATVGETDLNSVVDGTQLDSHGNVTTDAGKAVATIETTDSSLTYRAKSDSGKHELDIADTNGVDWNIDTSEARGRTQVGAGTSENPVNNAVNVTAGSGSSEVAVYSNADSRITGGDGNLTATVGGSGDHHVTAGSGSKNELKDFGTGENVLTGGSGKNTFESSNENGKLVAGTGKNTFKTTAGFTNKVEGFTYGKDEVAIGAAVTDYSDFHVGEGTISYGGKDSGGEVDVSSGTGTGSAYAVTILDSKGKKTNVGWTGEDGGTLDASSETKPLVLIGNQNGDAKDLLMGGAGRDVIFAGEGDSVTGGAGSNEIHLSGSSIAVGFGTAGARDEVTGFKAGFDESEADSILLMDTAVAENLTLSYDGKEAVLKSGGSRMTLDSIAKNNNTNAAELLIGEAKVAAIEKGKTANIKEADYADVYYGTGSAGLNFKEVRDELIVDLSDTFKFRNIASVTGGAGNTLLMGGSGKTTLVSGGGDTSLWGGTGNALLVGAKDARDEFFFFGESGRDTIAGFAAGTEDNSDVLNLFGSAITDIRGTNNGVEISTTENSRVLLQGLKPNDKIQWVSGEAKGVAKIGSGSQANTFTYDEEVTNYFGGDKTDTLKVSGEDHSVWLENLGSSIEIIDASSSTGDNILAGGREAETIKGGRGSTSIWGGAGGNDVLEGGSGYNEFYFGKGEGTDLITKSNDGDKVMLYNVKLEDLNAQATGLKDGSMVIALKDGSTLTLQNYDSHGATTLQLADGTFSYDRKTGSWQEIK